MGPAYRLILDESVEHQVLHRLENAGHDVEHVEFVPELGKGVSDTVVAEYSLTEDRFVVTYDDDFVTDFAEDDYRATLFFADETIPAADVADAIDNMSVVYPPDEITGLVTVGREWLVD